jgi:hypothetical protein
VAANLARKTILMYTGLTVFGRALWRTFFRSRGTAVRWNRKRIVGMAFYLPFCVIVTGMHWIGFLLDEIFFPAYRQVDVKQPWFIVGPPRSGTTFLHRILARDKDRFTSFALWEILFAPSITERKVFYALAKVDALVGGPIARWMRRFESGFFEDFNKKHTVSFLEPEEDFVLLTYVFANPVLMSPFPFEDLLGNLWDFDAQMPRKQRDYVMRYYHRCVQRHLYVHGTDKIFLSKNPFFTSLLGGLKETFPDAKFVCNMRTPFEAVPSFLGLWDSLYDAVGNDREHPVARDFPIAYMRRIYAYAIRGLEPMPEDRSAFIEYTDLTTAPREVVTGLYHQFGQEVTPRFDMQLHDADTAARNFVSHHEYTLEDFGITAADCNACLEEVPPRMKLQPVESNV